MQIRQRCESQSWHGRCRQLPKQTTLLLESHMRSILICDDEPMIRAGLKSMLEEIGFDAIIECSDGEKAVEMALANLPDMAILDLLMPGMDGISAAKEIRKKLKIPIIMLTSCYDGEIAKRAAAAGIASFLTKPLRKQDLIPALELSISHTAEVEGLKEEVQGLKETIENRKIIEKAKGVLMDKNHLSEADAYRAMQKMAMDRRKSLRQIADSVLKG